MVTSFGAIATAAFVMGVVFRSPRILGIFIAVVVPASERVRKRSNRFLITFPAGFGLVVSADSNLDILGAIVMGCTAFSATFLKDRMEPTWTLSWQR